MGHHAKNEQGKELTYPKFTNAELETGRLLFAQESTFLLGVARLEQLPDDSLPEIAFASEGDFRQRIVRQLFESGYTQKKCTLLRE